MDTSQDQPQTTPKQQVIERLKQANNVLVTVKSNPNVDELSAAIGLTLMLNKLEKHTTAVFSGVVPSTLEFLKPEQTIETNTDSLRDFIVSLDKSKADKLRYKVEENVVRIYITPYRTSISEQDLEFTQGDFNVDAVIALGVTQREELDQAITNHGRILHDATVITVTAGQDVSELGQINWQEPAASSLSEMLVNISEAFQGGLIDEQIATAYLTGIVSETERFSNPKTSPKVMTMAAQLMAAGANQQLIANELEKAVEVDVQAPLDEVKDKKDEEAPESVAGNDGTLSINHSEDAVSTQSVEEPETTQTPAFTPPETLAPPSEKETSSILPPLPPAPAVPEAFNPLVGAHESGSRDSAVDELPKVDAPLPEPERPAEVKEPVVSPPVPVVEPTSELPPLAVPDFGQGLDTTKDDGQIHIDHEGNMIRNAAASPKHKVVQPLSEAAAVPEAQVPAVPLPEPEALGPVLSEDKPELPVLSPNIPTPTYPGSVSEPTLEQLEESVHSPHLAQDSTGGLDTARNAVESALGQGSFDASPTPRADLNAMPLPAPSLNQLPLPGDPGTAGLQPLNDLTSPQQENSQQQDTDQMAPPPVPPPMFPPA